MTYKEFRELMEEGNKGSRSILRYLLEAILYVLLVWFGATLLVKYVVQRTIVEGTSMEDTLEDGDNLLVDKLSYRYTDPERFDIIVFPSTDPNNGSEVLMIKRIVALPGDTVQIKNGQLYVNGAVLSGDPVGEISLEYAGIASEPITLGEDEYFVMGDNRNNSRDSRSESVRVVKRETIIGKAMIRILPLSKFGKV